MQRTTMIPAAPPRAIKDIFTDDENARLFAVLRAKGPWRLIAGLYFSSVEQLLAVSSAAPEFAASATLADFLTPAFRGFFGNNGVVHHEEVHDIFYSAKLLGLAKAFHGARYGAPYLFQFNIQGPSAGLDGGHFDGRSWRGMDPTNTPAWLMSVMAKSGLFDAWEVAAAQVISYYYRSDIDGGFTYWPDGPAAPPKRFMPPFWNSGFVTDNQHMFHRGEACGPRELRQLPEGMTLASVLAADDDDGWNVMTDEVSVAHYRATDMRILYHYSAHVFQDMADLKRYCDHTDDLNRDRAFDMLIDDLKRRCVRFVVPSDPENDSAFIATLTQTYALAPAHYPVDAPLELARGR